MDKSDTTGTMKLRDWAAWMRPLGPVVMSIKNRREDARRQREIADLGMSFEAGFDDVLAETEELCDIYRRLYPANAQHWRFGDELVKAHASGPAPGLDVVRRSGFVHHERRGLEMPDWWNEEIVVPLEFMDYAPEHYSDDALHAAGIAPERFHALARCASNRTWIGYYTAKGRLQVGGVSLLVKDVTDVALQLTARVDKPKDAPHVIYVIGISEDEVAALVRPDTCVIGFNRGHSPIVEKLIRAGQIKHLTTYTDDATGAEQLAHQDTLEPFRPQAGRCFLYAGDVKHGLPVPDASGIMMTNYTLHHNSFEDQAIMIREMHRTAAPVRGGGRAWVAGEMVRNAHFIPTLFGPVSTKGPTVWDAFVSFVNGVITVEHHRRKAEQWAAEGIHLRFTEVPKSLAAAPSLVHRLLMPPTKVLITGF